jgi:cephalosporin hydroxylase
MFDNINEAIEYHQDIEDIHRVLYTEFTKNVNQDIELKRHRDFVEQNQYGYGERAFHWMWNLIVKELPQEFRLLEIGVYQGQVISLVSMMNKRYSKHGEVIGLSPLTNVDDKYSKHPNLNYEERISMLYGTFELDATDLILIKGLSNDPIIIQKVKDNYDSFDCVYIDGGHDYETVISDIETYSSMIKIGGYLIMDDSACKFNIPNGLVTHDWKGLPDVCRAVEDVLEKDNRFQHIFSVAHNRIWKRIS